MASALGGLVVAAPGALIAGAWTLARLAAPAVGGAGAPLPAEAGLSAKPVGSTLRPAALSGVAGSSALAPRAAAEERNASAGAVPGVHAQVSAEKANKARLRVDAMASLLRECSE